MAKGVLVFLFVSSFAAFALSANILVLYSTCAKSHKISVMPILEELAERGHQINVVSPFSPSKKVKNINEIVLPLMDIIDSKEKKNFDMKDQGPTLVFTMMINQMTRATRVAYDYLMNNQEFLQIIKDRKVDLIIYYALFNDFSAIIAHHLKVPYITHNSASGFP